MANFKNEIHLSVKLNTKNQVEGELNKLISQLNKNKIELNINTSNLRKNLQDAFNLDGVTKSAYASAKVFENELNSIGDKLGKIREKSERKNRENNALQEAKDTNRALDEQYKLEQQMATIRSKADYNSKQRELKEQNELNKALEEEKKIIDEIESKRLKSENKTKLENQKQELIQAKAINKALEDNYKTSLKEVEAQRKLEQQMANIKSKADANSSKRYRNEELAQAKAINKALEDNYKATLKEAEAQKQVQQEIQKQIKLLEIRKQGMLSKDNTFDTSAIDTAIAKYKQLDNISMKDLRNEISYINTELKNGSIRADSFMSKIGKGLSNIGIYINAGDIFRGIINSAKDAVNYVMDVENSMIDLRRVVDMSDSSANQFQQNMHNLSVEMASTNADTISTVATFSKLNYSLQEATQLGEITTKYNFAADINNIEDATLSLVSTMKSYKIEASDAIGITNDINEVSNKYAVSANDINTILQKSASTMSTFGNSLKQNIALGAVANEVMQNSDTVGQALKSIGARLTTNSNALDELEAMNISIEDVNGNLKSTYDIFKEMSPLIQNMKGEELARVSNNLFGKQQISTGLSIVQNYQQLDKVMGTLENTTGSVSKEFDRYLDSTQAKLSQLKENLGGLGSQFINSDMTKGTVDGLNNLVIVANKVISVFGAIPTSITTIVAIFSAFNSKFHQTMSNFTSCIPIVKNWNNKLLEQKDSLQNVANIQQQQISKLQALKAQYQSAGMSTTQFNKGLASMQNQLALTNIKMLACKVGVIALQSALTMGLSFAIDFMVGKFSDLIHTQERVAESSQEFLNSLKDGKSPNNAQELLDRYKSLEAEISILKEGTEEYKTKEEELKSVQEELLSIYPNVNTVLDESTRTKKLNAKATQELIDKDKELQKAQANGVLGDYGIVDLEDVGNKIRIYQNYMEDVKMANEKASNGETKAIGTWSGFARDLAEEAEEAKGVLYALQGAFGVLGDSNKDSAKALELLNNALTNNTTKTQENANSIKINTEVVKLLRQAQNEMNSVGIVTNDTLDKLNQECPELGINAQNAGEVLGGMSDSLDGVGDSADDAKTDLESLQNAFNGFKSTKDLISDVIDELQKYGGITEETYGKVLGNQEVIDTLNEEGDAIQNLTDLQNEQTESMQRQIDTAFEKKDTVISCDNEEANNKEGVDSRKATSDTNANNQMRQNASDTTNSNSENYSTDGSNFDDTSQFKNTSDSGFQGAWRGNTADSVNEMGGMYQTDYSNFKSATDAKNALLENFRSNLASMGSVFSKAEDAINPLVNTLTQPWNIASGSSEGIAGALDNTFGTDSLNAIKQYKDGLSQIAGTFDSISGKKITTDGGSAPEIKKVSSSAPSMVKGNSGGSGGGSSKGGSGSSGSGKSDADKAEEERIKNMEKLLELNEKLNNSYDRYFDYNNAYDEINNKIKEQETLIEGLNGSDKIKAEQALLDLKKQQIIALKELNEERKREANEIATQLQEKGFEIDTNGKLINSQKRLAELQEELKHKTYDISDAGIQAKENDIEALKDLEEKTKDYIKLVNNEIPSCTDQYNELANAIMQTQREQAQAMMDDIASALETKYSKDKEEELKSVEDWYNQRKENLESEYQQDLESLQDEKQSIVDEYDEQIKKLQAQLDKLNDTTDDKNAKLASLKAELALWGRDDSVFSKRKQEELNQSIKDLELEIQKDNLQKELDYLKEKQSAQEDSLSTEIDNLESAHNDELDELEKSYDERKQETEEHYDKLLDEQSRYTEASELMMSNSQDEILILLQSKSEDWKNVGSLLGENFAEGLRSQVEQVMNDLSSLTGGTLGGNNSTSSDNSYSSKEYNMAKSSGNSNSKSDSINGKSYTVDSNGNVSSQYALSNEEIKKILAGYETGGRTPSDISDNGALALLHKNEKILNSEDTNTFDRAMKIINTDLKNFIDKFKGSYNNTLSGYNNLNVLGNTTDLNSMANRAMNNTTNNNNSDSSTVVNMDVHIVNNDLKDVGMNEKHMAKVVRNVLKEDGRKFK